MKTDIELKAEAFDAFIECSEMPNITALTEQGRSWIVSASTLQAIFFAKQAISKRHDGKTVCMNGKGEICE